MLEKQFFDRREEGRKRRKSLCMKVVVVGPADGKWHEMKCWNGNARVYLGEEYKGLEGGAQKGRVEVCTVGCIVGTALGKPWERGEI